MKKEKKNVSGEKSSDINKHEDTALKFTWQYFKDEILPYLGIEGNVVGFLATENIHMELKKTFEDFNFLMEDGSGDICYGG